VLRGLVAQRLLPRLDDGTRIAVVEALTATPATRTILRDADRRDDLRAAIAAGGEHGMQTFEQHARELLSEELISAETAAAIPDPGAAAPGGS
jgi:twitching motility protein PilT